MLGRTRRLMTVLPMLAMGISGCATVISQSIGPETSTRVGQNDGIAYFLPRQLAKVTVTRANSKVENAIGAVAKAKTRLAAAEAQLLLEDQAVQAARDKLRMAETSEAVGLAQEELSDARVKQRAQSTAVASAQAAFSSATDSLSDAVTNAVGDSPNDAKVTVEISLLEPTADPRFGYRLSPRHMALRDDTNNFVIGSNGLLKTSNITAVDRTTDVLAEIGGLAGALFGSPGRLDGQGGREGSNRYCAGAPKSYTEVVDLAAANDVVALNDRLFCLGARLTVDRDGSWLDASRPLGSGNASNGDIGGIVYRTPVDVSVTIERRSVSIPDIEWSEGSPLDLLNEDLGKRGAALDAAEDQLAIAENQLEQAKALGAPDDLIAELEKAVEDRSFDVAATQQLYDQAEAFFERSLAISYPDGDWVPVETIYLKLPQAGPISVLRQDAGAFVTTEYDLVFDNGILTEYSSERPSEVLAIAETPLKVVDSFFEGVSQIISLRTGRANDLAALSEAQLKLQNARAAEERGAVANQRLLSAENLALANQLAEAEVAQLNNQASLSEAQQALLKTIIEAEYASDIARLNQQRALASANQELIQSIATGQNAVLNNEQTALASQLALLNQQNALATAQTGASATLYAAQVQALVETQVANELRACVERQIAAGESIDICVQ